MGEPVAKKSKKTNALREAVRALAMAALSPESPAGSVVSDTYVLKQIAEYARPGVEHIVLIGGLDSDHIGVYTLEHGPRSIGIPMPGPRWDHCAVRAEDGRVFVLGGRIHGDVSRDVLATNDPATDEWTEMPQLANDRVCHGAASVGDRIFVVGGFDGDRFARTCEVYSTTENRWVTAAAGVDPIPTPRVCMGVAAIGHCIVAVGGHVMYGPALTTVEMLNTASGKWTALPPLRVPRDGPGVAVTDDRFIWVIGGGTTAVEVFDTAAGTWALPPGGLPVPMFHVVAISVGHAIHVLPTDPGAVPARLDTDTMNWTTGPRISAGFAAHFTAVGI
jgi:hypothetical protein